jgi:hypothetical protein
MNNLLKIVRYLRDILRASIAATRKDNIARAKLILELDARSVKEFGDHELADWEIQCLKDYVDRTEKIITPDTFCSLENLLRDYPRS